MQQCLRAPPLRVRLTGDRRSGRLLGAQLLGHVGADIAKRIDILATAIAYAASVEEISDLDLSYTPPLGSPGTRSSTPPTPGPPRPRTVPLARHNAAGRAAAPKQRGRRDPYWPPCRYPTQLPRPVTRS